MRKLLSHLPVVCIVGLATGAHFVPVINSVGRTFLGWQIAYEAVTCLYLLPKDAITTDDVQVQAFVGCLSIPAFWAGVVALLLQNRISPRKSGRIAEYAGLLALVSSLGLLSLNIGVRVLPGCWLWMASIVLLTFAGSWTATTAGDPAADKPAPPSSQ